MAEATNTPPRKNYAIMRVERIDNLSVMRRVEHHNTREKLSENVSPGGPIPQELIADGSDDLLERAHNRMAELGLCLSEVEGAVAVEINLTTSHNWWTSATEEKKQEWIAANLAWLHQKCGQALLSALLHEDEKTPHIHAVTLAAVNKVDGVRGPKPKTEEGWARRRAEEEKRKSRWRWNYRDLFGGDFGRLSLEQDRYHAAVAHLGLERGERGQDVTDVEMDNGVVIAAGRLFRGKRRDGTDRPRRRITTKEYQAETRKDRAKAAKLLQTAEQECASAAMATLQAEGNQRASAEMRAEIERRRDEQDAFIVRQQQEIDEAHAAAAAKWALAEDYQRKVEAAQAEAIAYRDRAAKESELAELARREAEAAHAAAISERDAAANVKRSLEERRALHAAQIALLARAIDEGSVMDLRAEGAAFRIGPRGLRDEDRALVAKKWSPALIAIARTLARALDQLRNLVRMNDLRESEIAKREAAAAKIDHALQIREAQIVQDRIHHDAQVSKHRIALADLERHRMTVEAREASAAARTSIAEKSLMEARAKQAEVNIALSNHRQWIRAMDALEPNPAWISIDSNGMLRIDAAAAANAPPEIIAILKEPPPKWVISLATQRLDLAQARQSAGIREDEAKYAAEQLTEMIARAGTVLTPAQQQMKNGATAMIEKFGLKRDDTGR